MSELLTLKEAADRLSCSVATVQRRIRSGALLVFRDDRLVRVREDDLRRYVAEHVTRLAGGPSAVSAGGALPPGTKLWD